MKYKVGDKVKYDSGDWWFYGNVTAVIENPICPSYRLSVDRIVKKNCKFSITQFEFELDADNEEDSDNEKRKWGNFEIEYFKKFFTVQQNEEQFKVAKPEPKFEPIPEPVLLVEPIPEPVRIPVTKPELPIPEPVRIPVTKPELPISKPVRIPVTKPEPVLLPELIPEPESMSETKPEPVQMPENKPIKKPKIKSELKPQKEEPTQPQQPPKEETQMRRRDAKWYKHFELFRNGEMSNTIYYWIADNRRQFKAGKLKREKYEKLLEINFPFEISRKKRTKSPEVQEVQQVQEEQTLKTPIIEPPSRKIGDIWNTNYELYKKGVKSSTLYNWVGEIRRQYKVGKLSEDKILKLMEINFPFNARQKIVKETKVETPELLPADAWERNFVLFQRGERSKEIFAWISKNRRQFKAGTLKEEYHEKLKKIKFPF